MGLLCDNPMGQARRRKSARKGSSHLACHHPSTKGRDQKSGGRRVWDFFATTLWGKHGVGLVRDGGHHTWRAISRPPRDATKTSRGRRVWDFFATTLWGKHGVRKVRERGRVPSAVHQEMRQKCPDVIHATVARGGRMRQPAQLRCAANRSPPSSTDHVCLSFTARAATPGGRGAADKSSRLARRAARALAACCSAS